MLQEFYTQKNIYLSKDYLFQIFQKFIYLQI